MKLSFKERHGYVKPKEIQFESMDSNLRMRLYNYVYDEIENSLNDFKRSIFRYCAQEYFFVHTETDIYTLIQLLENEFLKKKWYDVYSFLEFIYSLLFFYRKKRNKNTDYLSEKLNKILEAEKSAYRFLNEIFVPISNNEELESIEISSNTKFDSVNTHIRKSLKLYSDRKNPDFENSIKESISAVEAVCCIIVEKDSATLSSALDKLKAKGVQIHRAQIEAYKKLYSYTSDQNGIRHAGIEFNKSEHEDAKFMLVACSAFINYLLEKLGKINE